MESLEISLHVPPQMWYQFRQTMLQVSRKNKEAIGFLFCQRHQLSKNKVRFFPKTWVVPGPDCYETQSATELILKQKFHKYLLETHLKEGNLDVVHIHTHTSQENPSFSSIDDRYESEYAQFLSSNFKKKPRLISGVFDQSLTASLFRIWDRKGEYCQKVKFSQSWLEIPSRQNSEDSSDLDFDDEDNFFNSTPNMFARQEVFGQSFQQQLGKLSVSLIGCGGIGSIFAELLGRLGVKKWLLIDPDRLETVNLNRMLAATPTMIEQSYYKVDYVKQLIKRIYPTGSVVKTMKTKLQEKSIAKEIAASDLIIVATDNHHSRQIAQELAIKYMRPLISLGTHIEIKSDGTPRMYYRVTIPPLGGDWCLICGNMINLQQAALELAPPQINDLVMQAGYIKGVSDPAVFWLNSMCASTAVSIIHGLVSGFINLDTGLDWIYEFPGFNCLKTDVKHLSNSNCYFCGK